MRKRSIILLLAVLLMALTVQPAAAADKNTTPAILFQLMEKFPHLAYWNHVGSEKNNPDGVTNMPCPTHVGCSWEPGACSCNSFSSAIQCMGFAYKVGYDIVGSEPRTWDKYTTLDSSKLRVGDIIRYRNNRHSLCVTGVKGNVISFVDANWLPMCQIRWASMDLADMPGFSYVLHAPKNNLKNTNIDFYVEAFDDGKIHSPSTDAATQELWMTNGNLNLRAAPSLEAEKVSLVPQGTRISVTAKKVKDNYLWGKITYGLAAGWVALDYCLYQSGTLFAPSFQNFSYQQPLNESFQLQWKSVTGADAYQVTLLDEDETVVKRVKVSEAKAAFTLEKTGTYSASVTSLSTHAPSWSLRSEVLSFAVRKRSEIDLESLRLTPASLELRPSESASLKTEYTPYCANVAISAVSSNNNIASISDNQVFAKSVGMATITYTDQNSGVSAACAVSVVPTVPQNVRQNKSATTDSVVALKWSKVAGVQGYFVYRQKADGSFTHIGTTDKNTFLDSGRAAGTRYVYKVKAYVISGTDKLISSPSEAVVGVTLPRAPKTPVASTAAHGKVVLKWSKNKTADFYIVYRHTAKDTGFQRVAVVTTNRYKEYLKSGITAYYKVKAVKTVNAVNYVSAYSPAVKVKTK